MINMQLLENVYTMSVMGSRKSKTLPYLYINRILDRLRAIKENQVQNFSFPLKLLLRLLKVKLIVNFIHLLFYVQIMFHRSANDLICYTHVLYLTLL